MAKKSVFAPSTGKEEIIFMGHKAKEALDNPAFMYALNRMEEGYFKAIKTSKPADKEARENIYYRQLGANDMFMTLQGMLQNMHLEMRAQERKKNQRKGE